jgi:hypothetical protein
MNNRSNQIKEDLLYTLARHLYNPNDISYYRWALQGAHLLSRVERLDPEKYAQYVKEPNKDD